MAITLPHRKEFYQRYPSTNKIKTKLEWFYANGMRI